MKTITIRNLTIMFDADESTSGTPEQQVSQAIEQINGVLQREPYGLAAQIFRDDPANLNDIEVDDDEDDQEDKPKLTSGEAWTEAMTRNPEIGGDHDHSMDA